MIAPENRALFLDRDGVINHDAGYTSSEENFRSIDGIFSLCHGARRSGYLLIVVTNQAGIGRGYYSEKDFLALTKWMCERFKVEDAPISDVFIVRFIRSMVLATTNRIRSIASPNRECCCVPRRSIDSTCGVRS